MLSAFVSIPAVKMDWLTSTIKTAAIAGTKTAVNAVLPGWGAAIDFAQAANDLWQGDNVGALLNVVSGVADICTLGLSSYVKGAMTKGAIKSTTEGAKVMGKKAAKEATKEVGHKVARQIAKGSLAKEVASKYASAWAEEARKKATKTFGKRLGKEIGRNLISESVEKVFKEGTKKAGVEFVDYLAKNPKFAFEFAKIAEEGAWKEFAKQKWKFIAKDVAVDCVKAGIRSCSDK